MVGRYDYQYFLKDNCWKVYVNQAPYHSVRKNLMAKPAPIGTMPVILGAGWSAVLLHEASGTWFGSRLESKKHFSLL